MGRGSDGKAAGERISRPPHWKTTNDDGGNIGKPYSAVQNIEPSSSNAPNGARSHVDAELSQHKITRLESKISGVKAALSSKSYTIIGGKAYLGTFSVLVRNTICSGADRPGVSTITHTS